MEAFDISPSYSGSSTILGVDDEDMFYGYVKKASQNGLLFNLGWSNFNGENLISANQLNQIISNIYFQSYYPSMSVYSSNAYFEPNYLTSRNLGEFRGIEQGVFSHYAKHSFNIPDIQSNLSFSHFYTTRVCGAATTVLSYSTTRSRLDTYIQLIHNPR